MQKSVFEGELTKSQLQKLTTELDKWVRNDKDSIIIFKNRNKNWLDKKFIGLDMSDETSNFFLNLTCLSTSNSSNLWGD